MERRGFLKGLLIGASAATSTAMVKLASPDDVTSLALNQSVMIGQPQPIPSPSYHYARPGAEAYVRVDDRFVPIGYIRSVELRSHMSDLTTMDGDIEIRVPTHTSGTAIFRGFIA